MIATIVFATMGALVVTFVWCAVAAGGDIDL